MTRVLDLFYEKTGICFVEKQDIVLNKIENFAKNNDYNEIGNFIAELKKCGALWQEFVNFLTVNETYFFREYKQLELLVGLAKNKSSFDILCLPSSSGEEIYTIVMMLEMAGILDRLQGITGVDINSQVIQKAKKGIYSNRSFHKTDESVKSRFFRSYGEEYQIDERLSQKCKFECINIFDSSISKLGKFDFVLSRNMLIYFDNESRARASDALVRFLKRDGNLFLGHADMLSPNSQVVRKMVNGVVYYEYLGL